MKSLLFLALGVSTLGAAAQTRRPTETPAKSSRLTLSWLPSAGETQKAALDRLAQKAGVSPSVFRVPASAPARGEMLSARELEEWLNGRERGTSNAGRGGWIGVGGQLLLARELEASKNATWRLWGVGLARRSALWVAMRDNDSSLGAQILEGFALPFINDLPDKAVSAENDGEGSALEPNKQTLLQDATNFYRAAPNPDRLLACVVALVFVAGKAGDTEGADWARIKLAQDLGNRGRFREAVAQLKEVSSPNLLGAREWVPELEQKATAADQSAPATQTPAP